jgi:hypothetical protein
MKKVILLLLCQIFYFANAQPVSYGNFKVSEQEIIYQKIFTADSITAELLESYYKTLPYISNITVSADGVDFDVNDITVDYKKFQYSQNNTPLIIQTGKFSGNVSIGIKDGKYRVTFQAIQVTGDLGYKKISVKDSLTKYACKNSGTVLAPDWCRPNMLGLLDLSFTDKLQFISKQKKAHKGDW